MAREDFEKWLIEMTANGDCDRCTFGNSYECNLQCTHLEYDEKEHGARHEDL